MKHTQEFTTQTFRVHGKKLLEKVNALAKEGNIRSIMVKDKHGREVVKFPLTLGIVGALISPILASVGLVAFFLTEYTIIVMKKTS